MGSIVVAWFGLLALIGLLLMGIGVYRRTRGLVVAGGALLLGLGGAWMFGLAGAAAGLVALAFLRPRGGAA